MFSSFIFRAKMPNLYERPLDNIHVHFLCLRSKYLPFCNFSILVRVNFLFVTISTIYYDMFFLFHTNLFIVPRGYFIKEFMVDLLTHLADN